MSSLKMDGACTRTLVKRAAMSALSRDGVRGSSEALRNERKRYEYEVWRSKRDLVEAVRGSKKKVVQGMRVLYRDDAGCPVELGTHGEVKGSYKGSLKALERGASTLQASRSSGSVGSGYQRSVARSGAGSVSSSGSRRSKMKPGLPRLRRTKSEAGSTTIGDSTRSDSSRSVHSVQNLWGRVAALEAKEAADHSAEQLRLKRKKQAEMREANNKLRDILEEQRLKEEEEERKYVEQEAKLRLKWAKEEEDKRQKQLEHNAKVKRDREIMLRKEYEKHRAELELTRKEELATVAADNKAAEDLKLKAVREREKKKRLVEESVVMNKKVQERIAAERQADHELDMKLAKVAVEMQEKLEAQRGLALKKMYDKQQRLLDIGKFAGADAAQRAKQDEERARRHQDEYNRKQDAIAYERKRKVERMNEELRKSLAEQVQLRKRVEQKERDEDQAFNLTIKAADEKYSASVLQRDVDRRKKNEAHQLHVIAQMKEDRRRKKRDAAIGSMTKMDRTFNKAAISKARKYISKKTVPPVYPSGAENRVKAIAEKKAAFERSQNWVPKHKRTAAALAAGVAHSEASTRSTRAALSTKAFSGKHSVV